MFFLCIFLLRGNYIRATCLDAQDVLVQFGDRLDPGAREKLATTSWTPGLYLNSNHWTIICVSEEI